MKTQSKKVAVALSGGIDSLVAAYLLKQQYSDVTGIHFSTGYEDKHFDLSPVEKQLDLKIEHIDLSNLFEDEIVNYFINTYLSGKTPNPCIKCNKIIKFGALLQHAKSLGADFLATGHYAKINKAKDSCVLQKGFDILKEQSYFLPLIAENELKDILFPLGGMTKENVREIAKNANLVPIEKKESQDICFLKNESIAQFIHSKTNLIQAPGNIITPVGKVIGTHNGLCNFTIGQRRGINCPSSEPYYVKSIDVKKNTLTVCYKAELFFTNCRVSSLNWMQKNLEFPLKVQTKIRYNHKQTPATILYNSNSDYAEVIFDENQFAVAPGQTAVFYKQDRIIGSGIIL
jgi:tRNA-uridine 2-sulfurtransferase